MIVLININNMKELIKIATICFLALSFSACDHKENEVLPDFLDGTEYGILLRVDLQTETSISVADISSANIIFDVDYDGDQRPVQSIDVNKTFASGAGTTSMVIQQISLTQFPTSVTLSVEDLISNVPDLSSSTLTAGDKFKIQFVINYSDGKTVSRFGTRLNPNFDITFQ
jgi:hypothetical protein